MPIRLTAFFILTACACFGDEPSRPVCNADRRGQFWPEAANTNTTALQTFARCGTLQICSRTAWKYKWQPLTVNAGKWNSKPLAPECVEASPQPAPSASSSK